MTRQIEILQLFAEAQRLRREPALQWRDLDHQRARERNAENRARRAAARPPCPGCGGCPRDAARAQAKLPIYCSSRCGAAHRARTRYHADRDAARQHLALRRSTRRAIVAAERAARLCVWCGTGRVAGFRADAKYCSPACRYTASNANRNNRRNTCNCSPHPE